MQLAADPVTIEIAGEAFVLRPTLLAAMRLTKKHGNFVKLYKLILSDHTGAIEDVIREGTGSTYTAEMFANCWDDESISLRAQLEHVKPAAIAFVAQLAGIGDDQPDAAPSGKPMPFAEFYTELFAIGTGALGWTPADTWAATPAEIITAHKGRVKLIGDILKAVFGSTDDTPDAPTTPVPTKLNDDGFDPSFDRAAYAAFRAKHQRAA